jgi:hypothetical protein
MSCNFVIMALVFLGSDSGLAIFAIQFVNDDTLGAPELPPSNLSRASSVVTPCN